MKIPVNNIKIGNIIEHQDNIWKVVKTQHVKPGKGGAYLQAELKNIRNGTKLNERFRSSETLEKVRLENKQCQFLYQQDNILFLMDNITYEQFSVNKDILTLELLPFLEEGMNVDVEMYRDEPISLILPSTLTVKVVEAEAVVKGQTAASSYKSAIIQNGIRVQVPPYINNGDIIVINTEDKSFVERSKK